MFWTWFYLIAWVVNLGMVFVNYFVEDTRGMILNGVVAVLCYLWFQEHRNRLDN